MDISLYLHICIDNFPCIGNCYTLHDQFLHIQANVDFLNNFVEPHMVQVILSICHFTNVES